MPRGQRFPIETMLRAMREVDNGVPVGVERPKIGMVEKTFYRYREKYARMEASEACRLRELENSRLKKLRSEQMLHNEALRDVLAKIGEARGSPAGCSTRAGRVRPQRAQRMSSTRRLSGQPALHRSQAATRLAAPAHACPRHQATARGLSHAVPAAAAGRERCQPQARLSPLPRGRALAACEAPQATSGVEARAATGSHSTWRAMGDGLRVRLRG
jgi:putative transposase